MSFFDSLGKAIGEEIVNQKKVYNSTLKDAEKRSDERLIKDLKSESNMTRKMAIATELKKRGYGNHDE